MRPTDDLPNPNPSASHAGIAGGTSELHAAALPTARGPEQGLMRVATSGPASAWRSLRRRPAAPK